MNVPTTDCNVYNINSIRLDSCSKPFNCRHFQVNKIFAKFVIIVVRVGRYSGWKIRYARLNPTAPLPNPPPLPSLPTTRPHSPPVYRLNMVKRNLSELSHLLSDASDHCSRSSLSSDQDSLDYDDEDDPSVNGDLSESSQSLVEESAEAEDTIDSPVQRKPPARYGIGESYRGIPLRFVM